MTVTVMNLHFPNSQVVCTPEDITKKRKEKGKIQKEGKQICKTQTLTASIQPNNKDILQILLAITYFTSCNEKSKIKDKKHK